MKLSLEYYRLKQIIIAILKVTMRLISVRIGKIMIITKNRIRRLRTSQRISLKFIQPGILSPTKKISQLLLTSLLTTIIVEFIQKFKLTIKVLKTPLPHSNNNPITTHKEQERRTKYQTFCNLSRILHKYKFWQEISSKFP
jgi:hypothetical protein